LRATAATRNTTTSARNLLVVLCSDHDATPVVNTGTLYN
jgi:hypothetical protein